MTGWARVEAGEHHPADILAGMALGNVVAVFASEAFLGPKAEAPTRLGFVPYRDGFAAQINLRF